MIDAANMKRIKRRIDRLVSEGKVKKKPVPAVGTDVGKSAADQPAIG